MLDTLMLHATYYAADYAADVMLPFFDYRRFSSAFFFR